MNTHCAAGKINTPITPGAYKRTSTIEHGVRVCMKAEQQRNKNKKRKKRQKRSDGVWRNVKHWGMYIPLYQSAACCPGRPPRADDCEGQNLVTFNDKADTKRPFCRALADALEARGRRLRSRFVLLLVSS